MSTPPADGDGPTRRTLRMHGGPLEAEALAWSWVQAQLEAAPTYWVVARAAGHPHPRPVWGVWREGALELSMGSPVLARQVAADPRVTVHLDSGTDVVIVEGTAGPPVEGTGAAGVAAYDAKYDWRYEVERYGPLTHVTPTDVLAWRAVGPAGRDGFRQAGRWRFG